MRAEAAALDALIESVADGRAIDWPALDAAAADERARRRLRHLKIVADIAELHRTLADDEGPDVSSAREWPVVEGGAARWGHLLLLQRIGEGTFGEVYHARDAWLDRDVALKLLKPAAAGDASSRILREARTLARLRHTNVVVVHGADRHDGRVGLWMELLRGRTLEEILAAQGPFGAREAALVGIDLCRALAAIHAADLVHRDIKAQNVMREDGGRIVLMDLGTGRETGPGGDAGLSDLTGSPLYIAPEIFAGAPASERTDLYSLGVLLYHLVTGLYPIRATSLDALKDGHRQRKGVHLRDARADLPSGFVRVVDRAIAADPDSRYTSAGEIEADLMGALDDARAPSPATTTGTRAQGWRFPTWRKGIVAASLAAAIVLAVVYWFKPPPPSPPQPGSIRSIAVLPLDNLSGDPAQEYFADGMTDELIAMLGELGSVKVISRTSVQRYKRSAERASDISRTLNVDAVIEGSVLLTSGSMRRDGRASPADRVRINARLILAGTDAQEWGRSFESDLSDVLKLQADVAKSIANAINIIVTRQVERRLASAPPVDSDAYKLYLLGRERWTTGSSSNDLLSAVSYFRQAISHDSTYARAYAGLADAYALLAGNYGQLSPVQSAAEATAAAAKAIELDPSLAEPHSALAFVKYYLQWDWAGAEQEFKRALELNPSYATAHDQYSNLLSAMGRDDEAVEEARRALDLDPLSPSISRDVAWPLFFAGRYQEAIAQLQQTLTKTPTYAPALSLLGRAHIENGQFDEGLAELRQAEAHSGMFRNRAWLAYGYARAGRQAEALRLLAELRNPPSGQFVAPYDFALVYAALGRTDQALDWLERAYREHDATLVNVRHDPRFVPLHEQARFKALLDRMGFPRR